MLATRGTDGTNSCTGTDGPVPDPTCPVAKAWSAVVASGVPSDVVALVAYAPLNRQATSAFVWHFVISGHWEYSRSIDARTCTLLARY